MLITKNSFSFIILIVAVFIINSDLTIGQRIVDKNKGDHNQTKKGFMDGNLAATVYYNFGEIADWENEPSRSGVWPKGTNHTYVDGVAIIVQAEATDPAGKLIHPLESNYYEFTRYDIADRSNIRLVAFARIYCILTALHRQGAISHLPGPIHGRIDLRIGMEAGMDFSERESLMRMLKLILCSMMMKTENIF